MNGTGSTLLGEARCRLASGGWCSLKVLEADADAPGPAAEVPRGGVPTGAGAAIVGAHGDCQVDDCVAFRGLVFSGGWDGVVRVADGESVERLKHSNNAWCYSTAPFLDGDGGLALLTGHTGGMFGDSESNLRLWRLRGRGAKRGWAQVAMRGHARGELERLIRVPQDGR